MQGSLRKMECTLEPEPRYHLPLGENRLALGDALGRTLTLRFSGQILCLGCGRQTSKSFNQGYCYPCFVRLAACDLCIVKPERCHFAAGTCREPDWAQNHCFTPHSVYLANTSGLKVGITRNSQIPTRWLDQGATAALKILETTDRRLAGLVEVIIARHVQDKTDWRRMLSAEPPALDLERERDRLLEQCGPELEALRQNEGPQAWRATMEATAQTFTYPVLSYPRPVRALNLDKQAEISGRLQGIKGQYLLLDCGVLNIRKYGGYVVSAELQD